MVPISHQHQERLTLLNLTTTRNLEEGGRMKKELALMSVID
jgi:hypothetical protein